MTDRCIALMGPFGYGNLGDAAIVDTVIGELRARRPAWRLRAYTLDPADTERRHGIPAEPLSRTTSNTGVLARLRRSPHPSVRRLERVVGRVPAELGMLVRAWRSLGDVDALVVCGSGQLQDLWGGGGPWSAPYTLARWALLARLRGAKVVVLSVGAGPLDARLSRWFVRRALGLAHYRSVRDEWSHRYLAAEVGFDRGDPVVPDLAWGLPVPDVAAARPDRSGAVIGVNPIGYHRAGSWPVADQDSYRAYLDTMTTFVAGVLAGGRRVRFLTGEAHYDALVVAELLDELEGRGVDLSGVVGTLPTTVDEQVAAVTACDVVVASRFHNLLLAHLLGRPAIGVSYQAKTDALMDLVGRHGAVTPVGRVTVGWLQQQLDAVTTGWSEADAGIVAEVVDRSRKELDHQYDQILALL